MGTYSLIIAMMFALCYGTNLAKQYRTGYKCMICGARRPDRHNKECPWKG